jgi:hypothetical protein
VAFNEHNPHKTQQQEPATRSPGEPDPKQKQDPKIRHMLMHLVAHRAEKEDKNSEKRSKGRTNYSFIYGDINILI